MLAGANPRRLTRNPLLPRTPVPFACPGNQDNPTSYLTSSLLDFQGSKGDFADPRGLFSGGVYYAYNSNNYPQGIGTNVPSAHSDNFQSGWTWSNQLDMLPTTGAWTTQNPNNASFSPDVDNPFVAEVLSMMQLIRS